MTGGGLWSVRFSDSNASASVASSGTEEERQMHFFGSARDDIPDMYMVVSYNLSPLLKPMCVCILHAVIEFLYR